MARAGARHFNCVRILPLRTIICPLEPADWKFARYCQFYFGSGLAGEKYVRRISENDLNPSERQATTSSDLEGLACQSIKPGLLRCFDPASKVRLS